MKRITVIMTEDFDCYLNETEPHKLKEGKEVKVNGKDANWLVYEKKVAEFPKVKEAKKPEAKKPSAKKPSAKKPSAKKPSAKKKDDNKGKKK